MADVTDLYLQAPALLEAGERVVSTDEMTGICVFHAKVATDSTPNLPLIP
jgi:hypothetical protein